MITLSDNFQDVILSSLLNLMKSSYFFNVIQEVEPNAKREQARGPNDYVNQVDLLTEILLPLS